MGLSTFTSPDDTSSALEFKLGTIPRAVDPEDQEIFSVLSDFLQPTSTTTATQAAEAIVRIGESQANESQFIANFFELSLHIVRQVPADHPSQQKLVDLIQTLRALSDGDWKRLLTYGSGEIAETWRVPMFQSESTFVTGSPIPTRRETAAWLNINAFLARLWTTVGDVPSPEIDFPFYAGIALRSALEGYSSFTGVPREEEDRKADGALDLDLKVAAAWMEIAGSLIWTAGHCKDGGEGADAMVKDNGGLYLGPQGLCDERWAFWKRRFGALGVEKGVSEDAKATALKTQHLMVALEGL